ncbi:MAG: DNA-3-methyladenine glycosylase I [Micrococcales bacterium]|nr:DNA-3-methyladenine glycosylase I [Micrococcales bacterium]NBR60979.1 DNA-3-methyladenine glycosylase I [Actinomycetota bacterium]NBT46581.1 DNA-3-methyladenine glycosylase I [Actinomycetota bacterium]NBY44224.1 DNA-3-methyladenine glycosylase I [Micrococcales bacterium]
MSDLILRYEDGLSRCRWPGRDQLYIEYHDQEWGVPVTGDQEIFERISLEGFQAGLSWITILKRREGFRKAFKNFDINKVAKFTDAQVEKLLLDEGIIRNRAKIQSTIRNAKLVQELQKEGISISDLVWSFAPKRTLSPAKDFSLQATSPESDAMSRELRRLGFGFVGSTTMYALMQATGLVNDHAPGCFRRKELA